MDEIRPLKEIRKEHIRQVLSSTGGDLERACRILEVTASSLRRMMKELGLSLEKGDDEQSDS